jgi:cobalt/nickel transport system permease protein
VNRSAFNRHTLALLFYLTLVVGGTMVHSPLLLGAAALAVIISAGPGFRKLLGRALRAALPFSLAVTLGYLLMARHQLDQAPAVLLPLNLRVLLLTALAFRILPAIDLQAALGFNRTLRFVLILATSQVLNFRRLFSDFQQSLTARTPRRVGLLTALRHGAATGAWFLARAEHDATEITQALETRGYFLDRHQ